MIGSAIGIFVLALVLSAGAYVLAFEIDTVLHDRKTLDSHKALRLKVLSWLFLRCKKADPREIYLAAFIEETIALAMALASIALLIVSVCLNTLPVMGLGAGVSLVYLSAVAVHTAILKHRYRGD